MQSLQLETLLNIIGSGPSAPLQKGGGGSFGQPSEVDFESLLTGLLQENPQISPTDAAEEPEIMQFMQTGGIAADPETLQNIIEKLVAALEKGAHSGSPTGSEGTDENLLTEQDLKVLEQFLTGDSRKLADRFTKMSDDDRPDSGAVLSGDFGRPDKKQLQSAVDFIFQLCKRIQNVVAEYAQQRFEFGALQNESQVGTITQQQQQEGAQLTLLLSALYEKLQTVSDTLGEQFNPNAFTSPTQTKTAHGLMQPPTAGNTAYLKNADPAIEEVKGLLSGAVKGENQGNTTIEQFIQTLAALSSDKNKQAGKPSAPLQEALRQVMSEQKPQPSPNFQQNMSGGQQHNPFMQQGNASLMQKVMQQFAADSGGKTGSEDKEADSLFTVLNEKPDPLLSSTRAAAGEDIIVNNSTGGRSETADLLNVKNIFLSDDGKQTVSLVDKTEMAAQTAGKPSVNPSLLIDQITEKIQAGLHRAESRVTLQLHPPSLGKLEISLSMEKNHLQAIIMTESNQIRHLLEANIDQLRNTLQSHHIEIDKMSVQVGTEQSNQFSTLLRERNRQGRNSFPPAVDNDVEINMLTEAGQAPGSSYRSVSGTGGIDLFA